MMKYISPVSKRGVRGGDSAGRGGSRRVWGGGREDTSGSRVKEQKEGRREKDTGAVGTKP